MKKWLLFVLSVIQFVRGNAQNWQCFPDTVKHYFTNNNHYLRCSDNYSYTISGTTYYSSFCTLRGPYIGISGTNFPGLAGGNWLGDSVSMLNDGTYLFHTTGFDTVKIKTRASVGDSWIFYDDTSIHSYKAAVIAIDTMTVLDSLDSVKTIEINAYASGALDPGDPLNSIQLRLGKKSGFVQIFDLNTFPYHFPYGTDYFYDAVGDPVANQVFHLTGYHNPTALEIYDFSPGDVFERKTTTSNGWMYPCDGHDTYQSLFVDSVIAKIVSDPAHIKYAIHHSGHVSSTAGSASYDQIDTLFATNSVLYVNGIPERCPDIMCYFYYPADTGYCFNSDAFDRGGPYLCGNYYRPYCITDEAYKNGFGLVRRVTDIDADGACTGIVLSIRTEKMIFAFKNGDSCGTYEPLYPTPPPSDTSASIKNQSQFVTYLQVFPNPATDELTIKTNITQPHTITLTNMIGQVVATVLSAKHEETINVSKLPAGVYNVSVTDEGGNKVNKKVVVVH